MHYPRCARRDARARCGIPDRLLAVIAGAGGRRTVRQEHFTSLSTIDLSSHAPRQRRRASAELTAKIMGPFGSRVCWPRSAALALDATLVRYYQQIASRISGGHHGGQSPSGSCSTWPRPDPSALRRPAALAADQLRALLPLPEPPSKETHARSWQCRPTATGLTIRQDRPADQAHQLPTMVLNR
jgi:hypothetical protein